MSILALSGIAIYLKVKSTWFFLIIIFVILTGYLISWVAANKEISGNYFEKLNPILETLKYVFTDKKLILMCLIVTFIGQIIGICSIYILSLQTEIQLHFLYYIMLMPPVMLAASIPISYNGWGIREVAMIYMFGLAEIPAEKALMLSIQFGIVGILLWSLGLLFWMWNKGKEVSSNV